MSARGGRRPCLISVLLSTAAVCSSKAAPNFSLRRVDFDIAVMRRTDLTFARHPQAQTPLGRLTMSENLVVASCTYRHPQFGVVRVKVTAQQPPRSRPLGGRGIKWLLCRKKNFPVADYNAFLNCRRDDIVGLETAGTLYRGYHRR